VTVILAAGISAVLARSFSRTFFRNAVNNGLLPIECDTSGIREGAVLHLTFASGTAEVVDETAGSRVASRPMPAIMLEILEAGGLVPYIRRGGLERRV